MASDDSKPPSKESVTNPFTTAFAVIFTTVLTPILIAVGINLYDVLVEKIRSKSSEQKQSDTSTPGPAKNSTDAVKADLAKFEMRSDHSNDSEQSSTLPDASAPGSLGAKTKSKTNQSGRPANNRKRKSTSSDPSNEAAEDKFRSLLNGKDLSGWSPVDPKNWSIVPKTGALIGQNTDHDSKSLHSWIHTEASFTDFRLRVEMVLDAETDSGIVFRTRADPNYDDRFSLHLTTAESPTFGNGMLMGLRVNQGHPNTKPFVATTLKGKGEINVIEITFIGTHLQATINGKLVQDVLIDQKSVNAVSSKKFVSPSGHLGIQCRLGRVEIQKFEVQDLYSNSED